MTMMELKNFFARRLKRIVSVLGICMLILFCYHFSKNDEYAQFREFLQEDEWVVYYNGKKVDIESFDFGKEYSGIMINNKQKKIKLKQSYQPGDILYIGIKLDVTIEEELKEK